MITYRQQKARKKWLSLINNDGHFRVISMLCKLKVIDKYVSDQFLYGCSAISHEAYRNKRSESYSEDKPYYDRKMSIKPTKARR